MSRPWTHPKTGVFRLRKRVPEDLRSLGGKREELRSLRTKDAEEAKRRFPKALAEVEERWANLRRPQRCGVSAPSLYTAFGDKKQLFLQAMRLYAGDPEGMARAIGNAPTALQAASDLMTAASETYTSKTTPPGCLLASATASGSAASADVQAARIRAQSRRQILAECSRSAFRRDREEADAVWLLRGQYERP